MVKPLLLIDTSHELGFVALMEGEELLFYSSLLGRESAQHLLPELERQLGRLGIALSSLELIAVANGPGSYTGVRLGVIAAEALAYGCSLPLVAVHSLASYAPPPSSQEESFAVLFDARIGGVYVALGKRKGEEVSIGKPYLSPLDGLAAHLEGVRLLLSPHSARLQLRWSAAAGCDWIEAAPQPLLMRKAALAANTELEKRTLTVPILYLRVTEAESQLATKRET